ncbi:MAG: thiamine pyrophosphate-binding protein, partial [Variibacter sp.]|nr:thiamine pyrophosphate-binding protein [Variibacter sp.]
EIHKLRADAKLAALALVTALEARKPAAGIRSAELARRIKDEPADDGVFPVAPGLLDPRAVIDELDRVIPKDFDSVSGSGHQSYFHTVMRGRRPENYHAMRDFGAIGNGIAFAIGVASARKNGKVVLFEGDGSLLMHIQEFEMIERHKLKLLICVLNDGAYGSEIHKLRADGIDDSGSVFGRTDLASIARGFGLRGTTVTDTAQFKPLFEAYQAQDKAELWNIQVSDQVVNPGMRRATAKGHGRI